MDPNNPQDFLNMARSMRRPIAQRFDEYYRCYPMVMAPGPERTELNYGSKILLPPSALDKVSKLHVQWPLLMELINGEKGSHSHAGVLEFMMQTLLLDVGDMIQIRTTSLELATLVKLQPQSVNFLDISDPKAVLERAFRNFASLTKGDVFNFEYNDTVYDVAVLDVKPETEKMGVCMIETDVSVEFAPPVGYVEPSKPVRSGTSTPRSTRGGLPAGGLLHNQGTMAQAINYDAIAPSSAAAQATNFQGGGNKIGGKKGSKVSTPQPVTPVAGASANKEPGTTRRRTNGPLPLRLPPNKLFLGYDIKPYKSKEQKDKENATAQRPHFAGQGQTLRGVVKKKGESEEEPKAPEKKPDVGRRLDGKSIQ
ncbi:Ubiquitin fusion degradation protein 1 [Cytospora mali]|uniref:Ubiquitin fusion degradation protein 1 n=1 Tax=Cytospora mali TaxID=578113 RepID=A0A194V7V3_CYTMA|nr:Ubiquitin fusion degradation protein 1 [Valsa mali var. pyri (nom. inval.)]